MPHTRSWLWWLAIFILVAGGALAYVLSLDTALPYAGRRALLVISLSIALAGVCVISATAGWWLRR